MRAMTDGAFDARVAAKYDRDVAERFEPEQLARTVDVLAVLADGRPVLEFAIGTGRIALPLAARNAAAHLGPGGHFLIETGIPRVQQLACGERFLPFEVTPDHLGIDEYHLVAQRLVSYHYWIADGDAATFESHHRYAWPAEYDLMAELAGMTLTHRWADWSRTSLTAESESHISVWSTAT